MKKLVVVAQVLIALVVLALVRHALFTPVSSLAAFAALAFLAAGALLAFAGWDYARKPSFRVRRAPATSIDAAGLEIRPAINPALDWTYAPRAA